LCPFAFFVAFFLYPLLNTADEVELNPAALRDVAEANHQAARAVDAIQGSAS
jgi:hypothetical protein